VEGLFRSLSGASSAGGTCILTCFIPGGFARVRQEWERATEVCLWEATIWVRFRCDEATLRPRPREDILYPELIYRRAVGDGGSRTRLKIPRRCYAPEASSR